MSIDMYVGSAQSQASSTVTQSKQDQQSYQGMIQALQQFVNELRLNSDAYSNGKQFYNAVLIPLVQAGTLLSDAVGEACQKFVQEYQSSVDSGDLKSDELEERIRQIDLQISRLDTLCSELTRKDISEDLKRSQSQQIGMVRGRLLDTKTLLQEKLDKLREFHARSPEIFANIAELRALVDKGADQTGSSWTGNGFTIPKDLSWTTTVSEKWTIRTEKIKAKERMYHETKIKELENYTIYAMPYEDPKTGEVKILWFIDKDGVRVFNEDLQNYVEKYGKKLEGMYEIVDWQKIYELDLAARRRGDGKNYLNDYQLVDWGKGMGKLNAHIETGYWYAHKSGLMDLAVIAGLSYAASKSSMKASTAKNVTNVLDDVGKKATRALSLIHI